MKKIVLVLLVSLVIIPCAFAYKNLYYTLGPSVGASGQALDKAATLYETVGIQNRIGLVTDNKYSTFVSAHLQYGKPIKSFSQFSALPRSLFLTTSVGAGYYFNKFALLADIGVRAVNVDIVEPNVFIMGHAGITAEFVITQKNKHSLVASIPFTVGISQNGSFFSTGLGINYQFGVQE